MALRTSQATRSGRILIRMYKNGVCYLCLRPYRVVIGLDWCVRGVESLEENCTTEDQPPIQRKGVEDEREAGRGSRGTPQNWSSGGRRRDAPGTRRKQIGGHAPGHHGKGIEQVLPGG